MSAVLRPRRAPDPDRGSHRHNQHPARGGHGHLFDLFGVPERAHRVRPHGPPAGGGSVSTSRRAKSGVAPATTPATSTVPTVPSAGWPWLDDRREITRVALYVQCAFEETVRAFGEEWARTEAELGCLLQWCAGRSTDANVVGAERRLSGFLARQASVLVALDLHHEGGFVDDDPGELHALFVGYQIAKAARWGCGAAALSRLQAHFLERLRERPRSGGLVQPDSRRLANALDVRRKMFLAEAVACATCAAAYVATDPRTVAVDLWQRTERLWSQDAALALLDECETARSRVPTQRPRRRAPNPPNPPSPVTPTYATDEALADVNEIARRVQDLDAASQEALYVQAAADLATAPGGDEAIRVIAGVYAKRLFEANKTAAPKIPPLCPMCRCRLLPGEACRYCEADLEVEAP